jgi:hypothetical protein
MNRLLLGIRICLTVGLALAVTALARQWLSGSCGACSSSGFPAIPLAGTVLYGLLLIVSLRVSELGVLGWGIALAVTAHGVLMAVQL